MRIYLSHIINIKPAPFQIESFQLAKEKELLLLEWPRYYGKSAIFGIGYPLWVGYCNPFDFDRSKKRERLMYISNALELCEEFIVEQKVEILHNQLLNHDFDMQPGNPNKGQAWRSDEYDLVYDGKVVFNIRGRGKDSSLRGKHPNILVLDDFEGDEEADNENSRDKLKHKFRSTVYGMLGLDSKVRHARLVYIGTPNHPECLIKELEEEGWLTVSKYPNLTPEGEPLWPDLETKEDIEQKRQRMGMRAFMAECMLEPVASENPIFNDYMIKEYDPNSDFYKEAVKVGLFKVTADDPAISRGRSADYSAIVSISATREADPKFFVEGQYCSRGRWGLPENVSHLADICEGFRPHRVIIETVAYQQAVKDAWDRHMEINGIYHKTIPIKPTKDKELRANAIVPALRDGRVFFDTSYPVVQALISEMMIFPKEGKNIHNDLVDAFVYAMTEAMQVTKRKVVQHTGPYIVLPEGCKSRLGIVA